MKLQSTDKVTVQIEIDAGSGNPTYGSLSAAAAVPAAAIPSGFVYSLIGGVEQSGFSSLGLSTDPFVQFYIKGPQHLRISPWGKIRLLGSPQPSTNGIGSTFTDPTGAVTKEDFSTVGESVDVAAGLQVALSKPDATTKGQYSWIAWAGSTTPLSSQTVAYTFKVPDPGTPECAQLLQRFIPKLGYTPGLTADPTNTHCLMNSGPTNSTVVTDIAFANQDRTDFLFKWGTGFRVTGSSCSDAKGCGTKPLSALDLSIGQDAAVTRGEVRWWVIKADGILPIPIGDNSLYLFGSIYSRLKRNENFSPLILATETSKPTIPSDSVIVLPLQQPNRDFFRLGIGLNLNQVFCKMYASTCSSAGGTAPASGK